MYIYISGLDLWYAWLYILCLCAVVIVEVFSIHEPSKMSVRMKIRPHIKTLFATDQKEREQFRKNTSALSKGQKQLNRDDFQLIKLISNGAYR